MKYFIAFFALITSSLIFGQVGINTSKPNSKSGLHVSERNDPSSTAAPDRFNGVIIQRYTTAERATIAPGAAENGLTIYNTSTSCYNVWNWNSGTGTGSWTALCGEKQGLVEFIDCNSIKVVGKYVTDKPLSSQTVHIEVPVKVTQLGSYSYTTNTVNGVTFTAQGTFVNLGPQTVNLYPTAITATPAGGVFNYSVTVAPTAAGSSGIICNNVSVGFINRAGATMKIVNVPGTNGSSLVAGTNSSGLVYQWLNGINTIGASNSALSYSGTADIQIVNVSLNSLVALENALEGASGIIVGANDGINAGFANVIKEWNESTGGFVINYADSVSESGLADILKFYVENGNTANAIVNANASSLPQIFGAGQPFLISPGLNIGSDGSNAGQISTSKGTNFINIEARRGGVIDLTRNIVLFGDKFGNATATSAGPKQNFARVLCDVFAYFIKDAPVY
ncbi:hypothetical protein B0A69_02150 [Chryseobacterium shigense]|nr:hypothetical protein B0A69_02150 [Chryseobacterium shigense]